MGGKTDVVDTEKNTTNRRGAEDTRSRVATGLAIIAGSGLEELGERLRNRFRFYETVAFEEIDGVGACTVAGHRGEVHLGFIPGGSGSDRGSIPGEGSPAGGGPDRPEERAAAVEGRDGFGNRPVALVLGRRHVYEGGAMGMAPLMRWLDRRGIGDVVAVSAAGSVRETYGPGELVVIKDFIDLQDRDRPRPGRRAGRSWASGHAGGRRSGHTMRELDPPDGEQSPALERAAGAVRPRLALRLVQKLESAANLAGVALPRGTLACAVGPAYESPAEIRALQEMGADVVTMSAAPEILYACELGMEIAVIAAVTNPGTGIGLEPPDHERVLRTADSMSGSLGDILTALVEQG